MRLRSPQQSPTRRQPSPLSVVAARGAVPLAARGPLGRVPDPCPPQNLGAQATYLCPRGSCCEMGASRRGSRHRYPSCTVSGNEGTSLQVASAPTAATRHHPPPIAQPPPPPPQLPRLAGYSLFGSAAQRRHGGRELDEQGNGWRADRTARGGPRRSLCAWEDSCRKRSGGEAVCAP